MRRHAERADRAAALGEGDAHAGERESVEGLAGATLRRGAGVLQPVAGGGGHPRRGLWRGAHACAVGDRWRWAPMGMTSVAAAYSY